MNNIITACSLGRSCKDDFIKAADGIVGFSLKNYLAVKSGDKFVFRHIGNGEEVLTEDFQIGLMKSCNNADTLSFAGVCSAACIGDIENFDLLARKLCFEFSVRTCADMVLALFCNEKSGRLPALKRTSFALKNLPTFAVCCADDNSIYCHRGEYPLFVGETDKGYFVSSSLDLISQFCERYVFVKYGENIRIGCGKVNFYNSDMKKIKKSFSYCPENRVNTVVYTPMEEVYCCPIAAREICANIIKRGKIALDGLGFTKRTAQKTDSIIITGKGSSFNAAACCAYNFEMLCDIPVRSISAGQLRYSGTVYGKHSLLIVVSHTGEESDEEMCVLRAKFFSAKTIAIVDNPNSSLAHICDYSVVTGSALSNGMKLQSFVSGYLTSMLTALYFGEKSCKLNDLYLSVAVKITEQLPTKIMLSLREEKRIPDIARGIVNNSDNIIYTGLGGDFYVADEGALALVQLTHINASSVPVGELGGRLKLNGGSTVIAVVTDKKIMPKVLNYLKMYGALGKNTILVSTDAVFDEAAYFENIVTFGETMPVFNTLSCAAVLYKLAVCVLQQKEYNEKEIGKIIS